MIASFISTNFVPINILQVSLEMRAETQADLSANRNVLADINKPSSIQFHDNL
jgi:hypothetical protein